MEKEGLERLRVALSPIPQVGPPIFWLDRDSMPHISWAEAAWWLASAEDLVRTSPLTRFVTLEAWVAGETNKIWVADVEDYLNPSPRNAYLSIGNIGGWARLKITPG